MLMGKILEKEDVDHHEIKKEGTYLRIGEDRIIGTDDSAISLRVERDGSSVKTAGNSEVVCRNERFSV